MTKQEIINRLKNCVNNYDFNNRSTNSSNINEAKKLYKIIFIEVSPLFKNNPSPEADYNSLAMMNSGCGNCEETIFRALKKWYTHNK